MASRMTRAWIQYKARDLRLEELPIPDRIADDQALTRVEANGVCGSDYEQYIGNFDDTPQTPYPMVIGHEPLVRVEQIGPLAAERWGLKVGDRVAVEPHVGCGVCRACTSGTQVLCPRKVQYGYMPLAHPGAIWGGLAEHMLIGGNTVLHKMPDTISTEDALMFNPLAAGFEWLVNKGGVGIGDDVLILGAGQRGLACVIAAKMAGANRIIITGLPQDAEKLGMATELGATDIITTDPTNPESLIEQVGERVANVVVDVVPGAVSTVVDAVHAVKTGGTIVIGGIKGMREVAGFRSDELLFRSATMIGALGVTSKGYQQAVNAILSGEFDFSSWHTHTVPLEQGEEAIKILGGEIKTGRTPIHVSVLG